MSTEVIVITILTDNVHVDSGVPLYAVLSSTNDLLTDVYSTCIIMKIRVSPEHSVNPRSNYFWSGSLSNSTDAFKTCYIRTLALSEATVTMIVGAQGYPIQINLFE